MTYNERIPFTRRIPTFLTKKQLERDAKIARQIAFAHDVEHDNEKMVAIYLKKCQLLSNPRYWEVMRTVWVAAGNGGNVATFRRLMSSSRPCKAWFMTAEDKESLDKMTFPITLYRAYENDDDKGISWSSNEEWVRAYAALGGAKVKKQAFDKDDVFAYISRRGEDEFIILNPTKIN